MLFALIGAVFANLGRFIDFLFDRKKAQVAAEYWEAQERWKLRATTYGRLLSGLQQIRSDLEMPLLLHGLQGDEIKRAIDQSTRLIEPTMLASLWIPEKSIEGLENLPYRLLRVGEDAAPGGGHDIREVELAVALLEREIDELVTLARRDLKVRRIA